LRYHRSRFFTFLFFMQKLSGNSLDKFNKSCRALHEKCNKIEFAFFRFFYDFLGILQDSAKPQVLLEIHFTARPLELFKASQIYPSLAIRPLGITQSSHPYPPAAGWARQQRWSAGLGQQTARDPLVAHLKAIGGVGRRGRGFG
jgi:hypothetical protein